MRIVRHKKGKKASSKNLRGYYPIYGYLYEYYPIYGCMGCRDDGDDNRDDDG